MSSGLSSDQIIKNEIIEEVGTNVGDIELRIFPEGSNDDQVLFQKGGLTFGINNVAYGSCDAARYIDGQKRKDNYNNNIINWKPVVALEGTDALQRGSSGNAQYQRFHHALGAVKNGLIGVYYLREGKDQVQPDLYGMASFASRHEKGTYIITQDLSIVSTILELYNKYGENSPQLLKYLNDYVKGMYEYWYENKFSQYNYDWNVFAEKRSTIIQEDKIIKYAGRSKRNFTDSSQRAGHIAVGEMFLTKYYFYDKKFYYLFPRFTHQDIIDLDNGKKIDKERFLLRHEHNVFIKTMDDLIGLPQRIKDDLISIKEESIIGGEPRRIYNKCVQKIVEMINNKEIYLN